MKQRYIYEWDEKKRHWKIEKLKNESSEERKATAFEKFFKKVSMAA